jgi:hypothetical protein
MTPLLAGVVLVKRNFSGAALGQLQREMILKRSDNGFLRVVVQRLPFAVDENLDAEVVRDAAGPPLVPEVELMKRPLLFRRSPDNLPLLAAQQPKTLLSGPLVLSVNSRVPVLRRPFPGTVPLGQQWSRLEILKAG